MEGNSYNCHGNVWNNSNDHFHSSLDVRSHALGHRQHFFSPDANKTSVSASNPYGLLLNYPQEVPYQQAYPHHQASCNQWQFPQWQSVKIKSSANLQLSTSKHQQSTIKSCSVGDLFNSDAMRMGIIRNYPTQNLAPSDNYNNSANTTTNTTYNDQFADFINKEGRNRNVMQQSNPCVANTTSNNVHNYNGSADTVVKTSARRKNPAPKKRKEVKNKSIKTEEKRKRVRNEESWVRNVRKKARAKGESYVSVLGKKVPARSVRPVDCSKCKFRCPDHVTEKDRENLFKNYWGLSSFKEKVEFICDGVQEFTPLRSISGKRAHSRRYKLKVNGQEKRVCKEFFLSTFNISESTIVTSMNKKRKNPELIQDMRGKRAPSNKTPERVLRDIREHILSQIGFQGIYDRLPNNDAKNVAKLYSLYKAECEQDNDKLASLSMYRKVFGDLHAGKDGGPILLPPMDVLKDGLKMGHRQTDLTIQSTDASETLPRSTNEIEPLSSSSPNCNHSQINTLSKHERIHHRDGFTTELTLSSTDLENNSIDELREEGEEEEETESSEKIHVPELLHVSQQQYYHSHQSEKETYPHSDSLQQSSCQYGDFTSSHSEPSQSQEPPQISMSNKDINHKTSVYRYDYAIHKPKSHTKALQFSEQSTNNYIKDSVERLKMDRNIMSHQNVHNGPASNFHSLTQSHFESSKNNIVIAPCNFPNTLPPDCSVSHLNMETSTQKTQILTHKSHSHFHQKRRISHPNTNKKGTVAGKKEKTIKEQNSKTDSVVKKRERKEETWARNVRKRLRFKGEEYTSVRGKKVEAKSVQEVDCSKCRFKCPSKISEKKRQEINSLYWSLDSLEKRIAFITKGVQLYKPKRLMTGRRAFSRRYVFEVDKKEVRVCKDFFQTTLHISESTVATALEKSQKGPHALADLRGKHEPANKTSEETVQSICELIIFMTGLRPHRNNENHSCGQRIKTLYQAYKFDSQSKGKTMASIGIFRSVLRKKFGISGNPECTKTKTARGNNNVTVISDLRFQNSEVNSSNLLQEIPEK